MSIYFTFTNLMLRIHSVINFFIISGRHSCSQFSLSLHLWSFYSFFSGKFFEFAITSSFYTFLYSNDFFFTTKILDTAALSNCFLPGMISTFSSMGNTSPTFWSICLCYVSWIASMKFSCFSIFLSFFFSL